jgi:hypothetical protein
VLQSLYAAFTRLKLRMENKEMANG